MGEDKASQVSKLIDFRRDKRRIEVIVSEAKLLEMGEAKEGAVRREGPIQAAVTEVEPNDMARLLITFDTVPRAAIQAIFP